MPPMVGVDSPWREAVEPILVRVLEPDLAARAESAEVVLGELEALAQQAQEEGEAFLRTWVAQRERERGADVAVD